MNNYWKYKKRITTIKEHFYLISDLEKYYFINYFNFKKFCWYLIYPQGRGVIWDT